ncbi:hypothetical protein M0638_00515 [Roseomonas sp. NAR14]|uniref:Methyltransferase family protein n=1 Tax=Roseomonas acroporae TaxID=2937791 RepID=A0A9X2BT30_9PROT|nr:hypothetical protein [Roseomonas acroporae]MCK8782861.1 hypothetical protein [Roseomonas acroporae]
MRGLHWQAETGRVTAWAREFAALLPEFPFPNSNGMAPDTGFQLYALLRALGPELVVESGVWRGFSTWVIRQAAPAARIIAIDPIFALGHCLDRTRIEPAWRAPDVTYGGGDFSCAGFEFMAKPPGSLVLFDDHQNKLHRLRQGAEAGFRHMVFDDNLPGRATHNTFFHYRREPRLDAWMALVLEEYEVIPPLWDTMAGMENEVFVPGLNLPREPDLALLDTTRAPRSGYSWLTYCRVRPEFVGQTLPPLPRD